LKRCRGCSYWDKDAESCNYSPSPVGSEKGRRPLSTGCKNHDGPHDPLEGQLELVATPDLAELCAACINTPGDPGCQFERDEAAVGEDDVRPFLYCNGFAEKENPDDLCLSCKNASDDCPLDPPLNADTGCSGYYPLNPGPSFIDPDTGEIHEGEALCLVCNYPVPDGESCETPAGSYCGLFMPIGGQPEDPADGARADDHDGPLGELIPGVEDQTTAEPYPEDPDASQGGGDLHLAD